MISSLIQTNNPQQRDPLTLTEMQATWRDEGGGSTPAPQTNLRILPRKKPLSSKWQLVFTYLNLRG